MSTDPESQKWALPGTVTELSARKVAIVCGKCNDCGTVVFPAPAICPGCLSQQISPHPVSEGGRLYSYSIVHATRAGWNSPYTIAYIDFPENVRICGPLDIAPGQEVTLDSPVTVTAGVLRTDSDGVKWLSHRFSLDTNGATPAEAA